MVRTIKIILTLFRTKNNKSSVDKLNNTYYKNRDGRTKWLLTTFHLSLTICPGCKRSSVDIVNL